MADGQSVAEGLREGKMLSDQIREQGQKQKVCTPILLEKLWANGRDRRYEFLEKQIREHGEQWLREEEEEQKKMMEAQMRDMKQKGFSWFGGK